MQMSDSIASLATALATAQATIAGAAKDRVNPAFKSNYATLSSVWDAWQAVGPANDLAVSQWNGAVVDGRVEITTMLMHKSGEWMRETASIPLSKLDAQGYVSAVTYGRRCGLSALAGIAPEDDDGAAAVGQRGGQLRAVEPTGPVNAAQLAELQTLADEVGADMARFCKYFQVESLAGIPAARFGDALAALNAKRKARA